MALTQKHPFCGQLFIDAREPACLKAFLPPPPPDRLVWLSRLARGIRYWERSVMNAAAGAGVAFRLLARDKCARRTTSTSTRVIWFGNRSPFSWPDATRCSIDDSWFNFRWRLATRVAADNIFTKFLFLVNERDSQFGLIYNRKFLARPSWCVHRQESNCRG